MIERTRRDTKSVKPHFGVGIRHSPSCDEISGQRSQNPAVSSLKFEDPESIEGFTKGKKLQWRLHRPNKHQPLNPEGRMFPGTGVQLT